MPWPKGQADWGYEAIESQGIMSRADWQEAQQQQRQQQGQLEGERPKRVERGLARRQQYYQAAVEMMQGAGGDEMEEEEEAEAMWEGPPGFADEDMEGAGVDEDGRPRVRFMEPQDEAVVAAERRYRARIRRVTTGLTLTVAFAAVLALLGARMHTGTANTTPDTILAPATLEENSSAAAHTQPHPAGGFPFPPPPPPAGEGPVHTPPAPGAKGKGGGKGSGKGRQELRQPEVRRATDGLLDTTFRILPTRVTEGPVAYSSRAYEGMVPGPTLVVKPGEMLRVVQVNKLGPETLLESEVVPHTLHWPNTTTIHTHGLHMDPGGIADNMFRMLPAGETAESVYPLRSDHQPGTFYYHPHFHGSSSIQAAGGMGGAIIVEDDPETLPTELQQARDLVCMLQHVNVASGTFRNYAYAAEQVFHSGLRPDVVYNYEDAPGNYFIVNGQFEPQVSLRPNEVARLRLINAGHNDYLSLTLPGCRQFEIAADGVYYAEPREKGTVVLVPGSRKDLLVQCPTAGSYAMVAVKDAATVHSYFGEGTDFFEGTIMHMCVTTADDTDVDLPETYPTTIPRSLPAPDPAIMYQFRDTRGETIDEETQQFDYVFTSGGKRTRGDGLTYSDLGVNGHISAFTGATQRRVKLGALEEWVVSEAHTRDALPESVNHPFHLHVNHFQIVDMSHGAGLDYRIGDWRDSISIPLLLNGNGYVTVRWRADDYTGASLAHCHILAHVDTGMSLTFEVYDPDESEEEEGDRRVQKHQMMMHHGGR